MIRRIYRGMYRGVRRASRGAVNLFVDHRFKNRHRTLDREIQKEELDMLLRSLNGTEITLDATLDGERYPAEAYEGHEALIFLRNRVYPADGINDEIEDGDMHVHMKIRHQVYSGKADDRHLVDLVCYSSYKLMGWWKVKGVDYNKATLDFFMQREEPPSNQYPPHQLHSNQPHPHSSAKV